METKPSNDCTPGNHDFEPSIFESGVEACRWCRATREAPVAVIEGVDVPGPAVRGVVDGRAA